MAENPLVTKAACVAIQSRKAAIEGLGQKRGAANWNRMHGYLVYERNRGFVTRAKRLLDQGDVFIAVGSFHLPGKDGLVAMLRVAGYRVERIVLPGEAPSPD